MDSIDIHTRDAVDKDKYTLAVICESISPLYDPIMPGAFQSQALKYIERGIPTSYKVEMIEVESQPIGFLGAIQLDKDITYLVALYFHAEQQRKGYGKVALEILKEKNKSRGCKEIILLAHNEATWAVSFYLKNGFEVISYHEDEIRAYNNGILRSMYLPNTVLMKCCL